MARPGPVACSTGSLPCQLAGPKRLRFLMGPTGLNWLYKAARLSHHGIPGLLCLLRAFPPCLCLLHRLHPRRLVSSGASLHQQEQDRPVQRRLPLFARWPCNPGDGRPGLVAGQDAGLPGVAGQPHPLQAAPHSCIAGCSWAWAWCQGAQGLVQGRPWGQPPSRQGRAQHGRASAPDARVDVRCALSAYCCTATRAQAQ
jgi:hypothetical protein